MEVLTTYPNAPSTRDALLILVQGYDAMGKQDLRNDAQRVLDMNFPDTVGSSVMNNGESPTLP